MAVDSEEFGLLVEESLVCKNKLLKFLNNYTKISFDLLNFLLFIIFNCTFLCLANSNLAIKAMFWTFLGLISWVRYDNVELLFRLRDDNILGLMLLLLDILSIPKFSKYRQMLIITLQIYAWSATKIWLEYKSHAKFVILQNLKFSI